jgi:hypothetical protein
MSPVNQLIYKSVARRILDRSGDTNVSDDPFVEVNNVAKAHG